MIIITINNNNNNNNNNDNDNETPSRQVRRVKGSLLGPKAMIVGQNLLSENCHDQAQ